MSIIYKQSNEKGFVSLILLVAVGVIVLASVAVTLGFDLVNVQLSDNKDGGVIEQSDTRDGKELGAKDDKEANKEADKEVDKKKKEEKITFTGGEFVEVNCIQDGPECNTLEFVDSNNKYWEIANVTQKMRNLAEAESTSIKVEAVVLDDKTIKVIDIYHLARPTNS